MNNTDIFPELTKIFEAPNGWLFNDIHTALYLPNTSGENQAIVDQVLNLRKIIFSATNNMFTEIPDHGTSIRKLFVRKDISSTFTLPMFVLNWN